MESSTNKPYSQVPRATTIRCPPALRGLWPDPLAGQWFEQYPGLFDEDDLRLAHSQPRNHFYEWLVAIHLFQRDGVYPLIEKYAYPSHSRKYGLVRSLLSDHQWSVIESIRKHDGVQLPDLLVIWPEGNLSFAEVKGHRDRLSAKQVASHEKLRRELDAPVEVVQVVLINPRP
jgi:hypothetical protein